MAGDEIQEVHAECWAGGLDERPEDSDGEFDESSDRAFRGSASYDSDDPWGVYETVDTQEHSGYACVWAYYTQQINPSNPYIFDGEEYEMLSGRSGQSSVTVHLHREIEQGSEYHEFWEDVSSIHGLEEEQEFSEILN